MLSLKSKGISTVFPGFQYPKLCPISALAGSALTCILLSLLVTPYTLQSSFNLSLPPNPFESCVVSVCFVLAPPLCPQLGMLRGFTPGPGLPCMSPFSLSPPSLPPRGYSLVPPWRLTRLPGECHKQHSVIVRMGTGEDCPSSKGARERPMPLF